MSASSATATAVQAAVAAPDRAPDSALGRPAPEARLRILPPASAPRMVRPRTPKAPFVILVSLLLSGGLVGLLLLNTVVDQDAFRLHALRAGQSALDVQEAQLRQTVDSDADPASLAARAAKLGMVPAGPPQFVRAARLPKGTRIGNVIVVPGAAPKPTTAAAPTTSVAPTPPAATASTVTIRPTTDPTGAPVAAATRAPSATLSPTTKATTTAKTTTTVKTAKTTTTRSGTKASAAPTTGAHR